jgi:hypothetical protein
MTSTAIPSLVLLLAGCSSVPVGNTAWQGHVRWVESDAVYADCARLHGTEGTGGFFSAVGCYGRDKDGCVIVTAPVKSEGDFRVLGHELGHCAWGRFHDAHGRWTR